MVFGYYVRIRKIYNCDIGVEERIELLLCLDEVFLFYFVFFVRVFEFLNICNIRCENFYIFFFFLGGIVLIVLFFVRFMLYICDV